MIVSSLWRAYVVCGFLGLGGYMSKIKLSIVMIFNSLVFDYCLLQYGYDSGILSGCLAMREFQEKFSLQSNNLHYLILSVPLGTSCIMSFISGPIADKIGRKKFVCVACIIHLIGTITQMVANTFASFLIGKLIAGLSIGMLAVICPLYQSEISLPEHRGRLISMHQLGVTVGFCIAFWIAYGTFNINNSLCWKIPYSLQILNPVIMIIGVQFIPESPRWLIYQGRFAEAKEILQRVRGKKDQDDLELSMEYTGLIQERNYDKKYTSKSYRSLLTKGIENNRKRTILGVGLHVMTQLTGINALMFYLPYILESTGIVETNSALLGNGVSGMVNMLATILSFLYIDKWGRKPIMIKGAIAMATWMCIIAILQGVYFKRLSMNESRSLIPMIIYSSDSKASFVILVFICLFLACFALSWGSMGWIYPAEIYPESIRARGLGITTGASFATSIFVSQIAPVLFQNIEWGTYLFFGALCLLQSYIIYIVYPETKGRSLEEIHLIFSGALVDQSAGAHHPQTAFEALLYLQQFNVDLSRPNSSITVLPNHPSSAMVIEDHYGCTSETAITSTTVSSTICHDIKNDITMI
ncbi:uncharacterized protein BX663DRAFT_546289 [Cokeromyces recurvatus]|uniref:uncharacterized protein n=1 Tax=Cokeromyces recurvatus TaxID=90255 RepID=UPI00222088F8|nr:uncharacterized protein BX663DRAFT_546289 [Cokeromyces recurvatus]KAI7898628.1 hypothetical protein BX663DRAFT_546289 [Cokeromyces recurvatus]